MAKVKSSSNNKVTFGKRKLGKYKKSSGPKDKHVKAYVQQGR